MGFFEHLVFPVLELQITFIAGLMQRTFALHRRN